LALASMTCRRRRAKLNGEALTRVEGETCLWATVGLATLTTAGLAVVAWRELRARPALERAMAAALGTGWRAAIDPDLAARLRRRLPLARILLLPLSRRRHDVERIANLSYGDAGRRNLLDLYRHRARPSGAPVLIHLHSGGYFQGRKNSQSLPLLYRLASQGWVCVSANYRLRPAARHPDHLIDLKRVIACVRAHGHEYGADPSSLFVSGRRRRRAHGVVGLPHPQRPQLPARLRGGRHLGHRRHRLERLVRHLLRALRARTRLSPLAHVRPDAPPFLIAHGDRFGSLRFERVVDAIEAFTAWVRSSTARPDHDLRLER
jgi:alpha/beta hydrolase fold